MDNIKKYAIIVAGGRGSRMNTNIPKQFLPLMGLPVLCHPIQSFMHAFRDMNIILVAPGDQMDCALTILKSYLGSVHIKTVAGGETRFHSVQNGLKAITGNGIVFVHDGVRPLISRELIFNCYENALTHGSAIPVMPVVDSVRLMDAEGNSRPLQRDMLRIVQTPQTFKTDIIIPAFNRPYDPSFTDEATVVEASGVKVHLIDGEPDNIKITNPGDMIIAETLLRSAT